MNKTRISFNETIEVNEEELSRKVFNCENEFAKIKAVVSPLGLLARRLEEGKIDPKEAAVALRGVVVLLKHKCEEIVESRNEPLITEDSKEQ